MDNSNKDRQAGEELFGGTRKLPRLGNQRPSYDRLLADMPDRESAAWLFCSGCGQQTAILAQGVSALIENPPSDWTGRYIEVKGCDACGDSMEGARVAEIPIQ